MTWFAQNFDDLQHNLAIADDFYALANIKINKDKTKILTNDKSINKKQHIPLKFGEDTIDIKVVSPKDVLKCCNITTLMIIQKFSF
ncbi:hypothetical protein RhiirC2_769565 [Rhizophagus irregularis]|uniref:Uncharacterized protein n=1 Tax=Rhizophagus irregularis TaxID=588596 RepID=A0A2N1NYT2_9GLOM|nr:hypothetical protein RhiirC2_769565 [Rhizophagus irregularis]